MSDSGRLDAQAYRNNIAERICKLEEEIRHLKSQHNTVAPVCRLPPEILSHIFVLIPGDKHSKLWGRSRMQLTHVCRYWRTVAENCAVLWVDLPLVNSYYTESVIPLSKNLPLSFRIRGDRCPRRFLGALYTVRPLSHRLKSIVLDIPWSVPDTLQQILRCLSSSAPLLETLDLKCDNFNGNGFPPGFLANGAPLLQELDLSRCGMRWIDIPIRSTLTSLSLFETNANFPSATSLRRPSAQAFFDALKQLGRLQSLALYGFLPSMETTEMLNANLHPRIALPLLSSLVLMDFHLSISLFFQTTHLPKASSIELNFVDESLAATITGDIVTEVQSAWITGEKGESPMQRGIETLRVWEFNERSSNHGQQVDLHFQNHSDTLGLSFYHHTLATQDIIRGIKLCADFTSSLKSLDLTNVNSFDGAFWVTAFGGCSVLDSIVFDRCESINEFIDALTNNIVSLWNAPESDGPGATTPPNMLYPSLNTIELCLVGEGSWVKLDQPVNALTRLGDTLKSRSTSTHPIRTLHINSSIDVTRKDLRKLRDKVGPDVKIFSEGMIVEDDFDLCWLRL